MSSSPESSSIETSIEKFEGNRLHEYALSSLLKYRNEIDPKFNFWLREKNTKNRLNEGLWFQGTEEYAFAGLYDAPGGNLSTRSIGLVFWYGSDGAIETTFEVIFRQETRENYLSFYHAIRDVLRERYPNFEILADFRYRLYLSNFELFLKEYRYLFEELVDKYNLSKVRISNQEFQRKLDRINKIKQGSGTLKIEKPKSGEDEDEALDSSDLQSYRDNFQIQLSRDSPSSSDQLSRRPFVDVLYKYVKRMWQTKDEFNDENSYTIHINGEWGSGKSTVMKLLGDKLEQSSDFPWIVVEFNSWQNQHISEPWWVFLDKVYLNILRKSRWYKRPWIWIREHYWRVFAMNKGKAIPLLILIPLAVISIILIRSKLGSKLSDLDSVDTFLGITVAVISVVGSAWLLISGFINSLLPGSEDAASNFKRTVRDPMKEIRSHYKAILDYSPKNVAVFIDDIDRCNPPYVVKILEGLQTLFRTGKVLYVIAGDANWIRDSFGLHYGALKDVVNKPGQSLGNFFLEKTLQQSINLPIITDEVKREYWKQILTGSNGQKKVDEETLGKLMDAMHKAQDDPKIDYIIETAPAELKSLLRAAAAEKYSTIEIKREIEHQLLKYADFLEPNPRSMKRLANNLALDKAVNVLSGIKYLKEDDLIRWAIFRNTYPTLATDLLTNKISIMDLKKYSERGYQLLSVIDFDSIKRIKS